MPPPPPPQRPPNIDGANVPRPGEVKFSPEEWAKIMKEPSWAYPPEKPPSPARATSKSRQPGRKQSTTKGKTPVAPKPATVSGAVEEEPDSDAKHDSGAASASSSSLKDTEGEGHADTNGKRDDDVDPMDIDEETPVSPTTKQQEPRLVSVPPIRPEVKVDAPKSDSHARRASNPARTQQNQTSHVRNRSDSGALKADLSDLAAAAPLGAAKGSGLNSVSDLESNLPHEPKASSSHPTKSFNPRTIDLPLPPRPPAIPGRPTRANWEACLASMTSYMKGWSIFSKTMLDHFNARSTVLQQLTHSYASPLTPTASAAGTAATSNWLAASGETTGYPGFDTYLQGLREDERVRQHWNSSCDKHKITVEKFNEMREKVRRLGVGG